MSTCIGLRQLFRWYARLYTREEKLCNQLFLLVFLGWGYILFTSIDKCNQPVLVTVIISFLRFLTTWWMLKERVHIFDPVLLRLIKPKLYSWVIVFLSNMFGTLPESIRICRRGNRLRNQSTVCSMKIESCQQNLKLPKIFASKLLIPLYTATFLEFYAQTNVES